MHLPTLPLPEVPDDEGYDSENFRKYRPKNRLYRMHLERFNRELYRYVLRVRPRSILEVGCGEGFVLRVLRSYGAHTGFAASLAGVDVRVDAVGYAARILDGDARLAGASAYELPFADDAFDLVVSSQVLEHLEDAEAALRELSRVARRAVLVTVPREPVFRTLAAVATWSRIGDTPGHVNFWSARGFSRFLASQLTSVETKTSSIYRLGIGWVDEARAPAPQPPPSG